MLYFFDANGTNISPNVRPRFNNIGRFVAFDNFTSGYRYTSVFNFRPDTSNYPLDTQQLSTSHLCQMNFSFPTKLWVFLSFHSIDCVPSQSYCHRTVWLHRQWSAVFRSWWYNVCIVFLYFWRLLLVCDNVHDKDSFGFFRLLGDLVVSLHNFDCEDGIIQLTVGLQQFKISHMKWPILLFLNTYLLSLFYDRLLLQWSFSCHRHLS